MLGTVIDPQPAYALGRGLKTLPSAIARHNAERAGGRRVLSAAIGGSARCIYPGPAVASGSRDRDAGR